MNIYARYFDQDVLVYNLDELIGFLSNIPDIQVTEELVEDIRNYIEGDMPYPKRYKIRPRVYFILIKTTAETLEEFKANKKQAPAAASNDNDIQNKKEIRVSILTEEKYGWYKGTITFKRVIQIPGTGKFQYQDTTFSALTKAASGIDCYNIIINHLKNRQDVDLRSQFPSAKGNNFEFKFIQALDTDSTDKDQAANSDEDEKPEPVYNGEFSEN